MRVVGGNSERDLARSRAMEDVENAVVELGANLMRVAAGAGRPFEIGRQAVRLVQAYEDHWEAVGTYPELLDLSQALEFDITAELRALLSDDQLDEEVGKHMLLRGALRTVAARLLGQRTQELAGGSLLNDGMRQVQSVRDRRRLAFESELKGLSGPKKMTKTKIRKKSRSKNQEPVL